MFCTEEERPSKRTKTEPSGEEEAAAAEDAGARAKEVGRLT
jgi:hypothetical protein